MSQYPVLPPLLVNCSAPHNETLMATCCGKGNSSTSADLRFDFCVTQNETHFGTCLAQNGVAGAHSCEGPGDPESFKIFEQLDASASASSPGPAATGSPNSSTRGVNLGPLSLFLLGLAFLAGVQAAVVRAPAESLATREDKPTCKDFQASEQSRWDFGASLPSKRVSQNHDCQVNGYPYCMITSRYQKEASWDMAWDVDGATAEVDPAKLLDLLGADYVKSVSSRVAGGYSVPLGQQGFLAVSPRAVKVFGTYKDCSDGKEYEGSATVPKKNGVTPNVVMTG